MPGSPVRQTVRPPALVSSAACRNSAFSCRRLTNRETLRVLRTCQLDRSPAPVTRYTGTGSAKPLQRLAAQILESNVSLGQFLAGLGRVDLTGLRRRLQPGRQMLRCTTDLVDLGEFAGDHIGDDEAGVQSHPDLQARIAQALDTSNQLDGGVAGKRRMIVVGHRGPEHRRQPIAHFLADDAAELTHRGSHRRQRRLQTQQGLLGFKLGNEVRRVDHVGAKDRYELSLAVGILSRGAAAKCRPRSRRNGRTRGRRRPLSIGT